MLKDGEIRTLKVDGEALEDEMECELEGETIQDAERVRSISIPGQSSKKEREKQETTYAQYKRSCVACVKRRIAMKNRRSTLVQEAMKEGCTHS